MTTHEIYEMEKKELRREQEKYVGAKIKDMILDVERCRVEYERAKERLDDALNQDVDDIVPLHLLKHANREVLR